MPDKPFLHTWLRLVSHRTIPYTIDDISVIIPSTKGRFANRMKWFWPQYVAKTHPIVVANTYVPCDPGEDIPGGIRVEVEPRWIVPKTLGALEHIRTRLTFRLANDIAIIREGWEQILLDQFNAEEKLQIIGELQNGISFTENHEKLQEWDFFKKEYPEVTTASEYLHGSRLFAQTAVWRAYYYPVRNYTWHDHDEIFFCQLARADGTLFKNFRGINLYLAHVGVTNKDFTEEYINGHVELRRRELSEAPDKHEFVVIRP